MNYSVGMIPNGNVGVRFYAVGANRFTLGKVVSWLKAAFALQL